MAIALEAILNPSARNRFIAFPVNILSTLEATVIPVKSDRVIAFMAHVLQVWCNS